MKIVELCGASGVGKSTVYREMLKLGGFVPNPKIDYEYAKQVVGGAADDAQVVRFVGLLDCIFDSAKGPRIQVRRSFAWRSLAKLIQARQTPGHNVLVIDGGLVQRGQAIARVGSPVPIEDYYRAMPEPDLIVMLTADRETIEARNRARGGDHDRSAETARSLEIKAVAMSVFAERGLNVAAVDATRLAEENAQRVCGWVRQLRGL